MPELNAVNLIQSATLGVSVLGAILLYRKPACRAIALVMLLVGIAALINILEETGISRGYYLVSPVFVMLFGPCIYLAIKQFLLGQLSRADGLHLLPVIPVVFFTEYVQQVIALGTLWRLGYAVLTAHLLYKTKCQLDEQRSDTQEYTFQWLVWVVAVSAIFNLVDMLRLNSQHWLNHDINVLGQGINNLIWLIVIMLITVRLNGQKAPPAINREAVAATTENASNAEDYRVIFDELQDLIQRHQWYLQPRLTLTELSQLTGFQTRDISRAINLLAGKSFNDYINQYRVEVVCQAIQAGASGSLLQIATDAGFSSKASFNMVFKDMLGQTPSQYKQVQDRDSQRLKS